jgi:5-methylcytosine-specific restriction endonuclease McrA
VPSLPPRYRPPHLGLPRKAEATRQRELTQRRGTSAERGYGARWQRSSAGWRREHPLCVCCKANGRVKAAELVDHIVPHKGDMGLFWDPANWQSLCEWCHKHIKPLLEHLFAQGKCSQEELRLDRALPEHFG